MQSYYELIYIKDHVTVSAHPLLKLVLILTSVLPLLDDLNTNSYLKTNESSQYEPTDPNDTPKSSSCK